MFRKTICADGVLAQLGPGEDDRTGQDDDEPEWGSIDECLAKRLSRFPIVVREEHDLKWGIRSRTKTIRRTNIPKPIQEQLRSILRNGGYARIDRE